MIMYYVVEIDPRDDTRRAVGALYTDRALAESAASRKNNDTRYGGMFAKRYQVDSYGTELTGAERVAATVDYLACPEEQLPPCPMCGVPADTEHRFNAHGSGHR